MSNERFVDKKGLNSVESILKQYEPGEFVRTIVIEAYLKGRSDAWEEVYALQDAILLKSKERKPDEEDPKKN